MRASSRLTIDPNRVTPYLKKTGLRVGKGASIYLAACIEYLMVEVLELSGNAARDSGRKTISPRDVQRAINNDEELKELYPDLHIGGGVEPYISSALLPKKKK